MKKISRILLAIVFTLSILLPTAVSAEPQETAKITLKQAIEIAKENLEFTGEGYDFNSSYYENPNGSKVWNLNWINKGELGGSVNASVDADTGDIINANIWEPNMGQLPRFPKYSKDEAQKAAEKIAAKFQPVKFKETKLTDNPIYRIYPDYYTDTYNFRFVRYANGIEFQDNGITIDIDKNTLKLRNYSFNWDKEALPDPSKAMSKEAAQKIFKDKLGIELIYHQVYNAYSKKLEIKLVYYLSNGSRPIDAMTGELLDIGYWGPMADKAKNEATSLGSGSPVITPEEQKVIEQTDKYITKEKAIEVIKKYIEIPENYSLNYSNLYSGYPDGDAVWYFSWNYNNKDTNEYGYISAQVDAVTGELKYFSRSNKNTDDTTNKEPKYTREQTKEIAEKFIMSIQPEKFSSTKYKENIYERDYAPRWYNRYNFNYVRNVNGIPFPENFINVSVSPYTGEVLDFQVSWSNKEFPSAQNAMNLENAYKVFFNKVPFTLKYIKTYSYKEYPNFEKQETKLAYVLDSSFAMMDPVKGDLLDYSGNPVKNPEKTDFTDIKGHWAEKDILALVDMNIIDVDTNKFMPDEKIKQKDFIKMIMKSIAPVYYPVYKADSASEEYDRYYNDAIARKIISKKDKNPEVYISRQDAAKMIVRALGLGYVAELNNIYNVSFKDAGFIFKSHKGYVAIASELGIIKGANSYFYPVRALTKAEAASVIVKYLKVDTNLKE